MSEIKQTKPFSCLEEEVFLNLQRTTDLLRNHFQGTIKAEGLTGAQYNILRILRGAGEAGLVCREIGARMITKDPDITRLLDRMEARGLVMRTRDTKDRRVIQTRITPAGLDLLASLDDKVTSRHQTLLGHLSVAELETLSALLEKARTKSSETE
ncbi:MAG: MarR family transcriptional regulator [Blastocatellia bacterium]|nr:MarR family transcriptional regulator [Blastocatellia bacterium]